MGGGGYSVLVRFKSSMRSSNSRGRGGGIYSQQENSMLKQTFFHKHLVSFIMCASIPLVARRHPISPSHGLNCSLFLLRPTRYSGSIAEYYYLNLFQVKEWTSGLRKEGYKIDRQINGKERILKELLSSISYD